MSTRASGFARLPKDRYETEDWATDVYCDHFHVDGKRVWECAAGSGKMARALKARGAEVFATDVDECGPHLDLLDFLAPAASAEGLPMWGDFVDAIVTNPPYGTQGKLAEQFISRGLEYLKAGTVDRMALLLRADFDSAGSRTHLFRDSGYFRARIVLLRRIQWFKPKPGKSGSSTNHAWFVWDRQPQLFARQAEVFYGP